MYKIGAFAIIPYSPGSLSFQDWEILLPSPDIKAYQSHWFSQDVGFDTHYMYPNSRSKYCTEAQVGLSPRTSSLACLIPCNTHTTHNQWPQSIPRQDIYASSNPFSF